MQDLVSSNHKKRVAIVSQLNTRGGVQSCVFAIMRGLNQRGIIPDVVWDVEPNWELLQEEGVKAGFRPIHFTFSTPSLRGHLTSTRYWMRIANMVDGSTLRANYDFFYIFYNGFLVSPDMPHLRYLSGPPLLPQLFTVSPGLRGVPIRFLRWIYRSFLSKRWPVYDYHRGDHYVINSHFTAGLFKEAHGVSLPVIHPPINLSGRSFADDDLPQRDTITFFSRVSTYKRPEMVIELASRFKQYRCVIMGSVTPERQAFFNKLKELAQQCGRPDIIFLATPSNQRVLEELARTRFYVFPAVNEHFGMTTPEAIASGAIPFVHDTGGQREIVPDSRLRFTDNDFYSKFEALTRIPENELVVVRRMLANHVNQYSEERFIEHMMAALGPEKHSAPLEELTV